ncbi:hypothetical protein GF374_01925 [Candidatus Woesearchaeota archaeon]|nr:hypothetical protein [Candidatus Woesearchaeota archaeon]
MGLRRRQKNAVLLEELEKEMRSLNQETAKQELKHADVLLKKIIKPDTSKEITTISRGKLENILDIIGDKWSLLPTAQNIAKQVHKSYRNEIKYLIDIDEFDIGFENEHQIAYLIAKTAALGGRYNVYKTSDEQKQK